MPSVPGISTSFIWPSCNSVVLATLNDFDILAVALKDCRCNCVDRENMRLVSDVSNELRMDDDAAGNIHCDTLMLQHANSLCWQKPGVCCQLAQASYVWDKMGCGDAILRANDGHRLWHPTVRTWFVISIAIGP